MFSRKIKEIKEILKNKSVLKRLKKAKRFYKKGYSSGMCSALGMAGFIVNYYAEIYNNVMCPEIPEYNRKFLNGDENKLLDAYWWNPLDKQSRFNAFDKLIEVYKKKSRWRNLFIKPSVL